MSQAPVNDIDFIETDDELSSFISENNNDNSPLAIDIEADSLYSYFEKLCLLQFNDDKSIKIIDPLAVNNLSAFFKYLKNRTIWMHGADYDFYILKNTGFTIPDKILDTQVAARLCGIKKFSLANIIKEFYGIELPKTRQKANWGKRPLSENMLSYAADDVRYLLNLANDLTIKLNKLGRFHWFEESCKAKKEKALNRNKKDKVDPWRIKGIGGLDRQGLAILRELWHWREAIAQEADTPVFKILNNAQLIKFTIGIRNGNNISISPKWNPKRTKSFTEIIKKSKNIDAKTYPALRRKIQKRQPTPKNFHQKVSNLLNIRNKVANKLAIDPTIIASQRILENFVACNGKVGIDEYLLKWQRELLKI